jgi:hypothetical protein
MKEFAVIIPDRGDRPELTAFCLQQIRRMTRQPDQIFHVNFPPIGKEMDLAERVYDGVKTAQAHGFDLVFIMENDDSYPANYFERFGDFDADFFGDDLTFYYNLRNRTFQSFPHSGRSSLFTTGFRISKLGNFQFSGNQFLDIRLWRYAQESWLRGRFVHSGAIGIKHGQGLCGGKGHKMKMKNYDPHMNWLRQRVDANSFQFYSDFSRKILENTTLGN